MRCFIHSADPHPPLVTTTTHVVHPPRANQVGLIADNMSIVNFESAQDVMREGEPGTLLTHS